MLRKQFSALVTKCWGQFPHLTLVLRRCTTVNDTKMSPPSPPPKIPKSCLRCPDRISTHLDDEHDLCVKCRGQECNLDVRCDACCSWSNDRMRAYISHQRGLARRRKHTDKKKGKGDSPLALPNQPTLDNSPHREDSSSLPGENMDYLSDADSHDLRVSSMIADRVAPLDARVASLDKNLQSLVTILTNKLGETKDDDNVNLGQPCSPGVQQCISMDNTGNNDHQPILQDVFLAPNSVPSNPNFNVNEPFFQSIASPSFVPIDSSSDTGGDDSNSLPPGTPLFNQSVDLTITNIKALHAQGILDNDAYIKAMEALCRSGDPIASMDPPTSPKPPPSPGGGHPHGRGTTPSGNHVPPEHPSQSHHCPRPTQTPRHHPPSPMPPPSSHASEKFEPHLPLNYIDVLEEVFHHYPKAKALSPKTAPTSNLLHGLEEPSEETGTPKINWFDKLNDLRLATGRKLETTINDGKAAAFVLHKHRAAYKIPTLDAPAHPVVLNDQFFRLTSRQRQPTVNSIPVTLSEWRKIDLSLASIQETQSFMCWLVSTAVAHITATGFIPQDGLFNRLFSSISTALADMTSATMGLSAFSVLLRRSFYLKFLSPTITEGQKHRLMKGSPFLASLFEDQTLKEVVEEFSDASATSSYQHLSRTISATVLSGKRKREQSRHRSFKRPAPTPTRSAGPHSSSQQGPSGGSVRQNSFSNKRKQTYKPRQKRDTFQARSTTSNTSFHKSKPHKKGFGN